MAFVRKVHWLNALAAADDLDSLDTKDSILDWILKQQYKERHPYTGADPGGWAWTDLPGGVPDCGSVWVSEDDRRDPTRA